LKLLHLKMDSFDCTMLDNLNILMDDNKVYVAADGSRIKLPKDVKIVLETKGCMV
jgi:hypothetical protein